MATKPTKPKILFVKRTDTFVQIRHESLNTREQTVDVAKAKNAPAGDKPPTKEVTNTEEIDLTAHDAPLESFDKALQALAPVVAKVMNCDPDWTDKVEVISLAVTHTENGTRSAVVNFTKQLLAGTTVHPMKTPSFRIDDDKKTGEKREVTPGHAERVVDMIKEAQKYVGGDRSQTVLGFEEDDQTDGGKIEQLPGMGVPGTVNEE